MVCFEGICLLCPIYSFCQINVGYDLECCYNKAKILRNFSTSLEDRRKIRKEGKKKINSLPQL